MDKWLVLLFWVVAAAGLVYMLYLDTRKLCIKAARHNRWLRNHKQGEELPPPEALLDIVVIGAPPHWFSADSPLLDPEDPGEPDLLP